MCAAFRVCLRCLVMFLFHTAYCERQIQHVRYSTDCNFMREGARAFVIKAGTAGNKRGKCMQTRTYTRGCRLSQRNGESKNEKHEYMRHVADYHPAFCWRARRTACHDKRANECRVSLESRLMSENRTRATSFIFILIFYRCASPLISLSFMQTINERNQYIALPREYLQSNRFGAIANIAAATVCCASASASTYCLDKAEHVRNQCIVT